MQTLRSARALTHRVACRRSGSRPHCALERFTAQWPQARAVQVLRDCWAQADTGTAGRVHVRDAAAWLAELTA